MKPVQIRRPFIAELKKQGLDISKIPENLIACYVRTMRKLLDEAVACWVEMKLHKSSNLDDLAAGFVTTVIPVYILRLKKEILDDLI